MESQHFNIPWRIQTFLRLNMPLSEAQLRSACSWRHSEPYRSKPLKPKTGHDKPKAAFSPSTPDTKLQRCRDGDRLVGQCKAMPCPTAPGQEPPEITRTGCHMFSIVLLCSALWMGDLGTRVSVSAGGSQVGNFDLIDEVRASSSSSGGLHSTEQHPGAGVGWDSVGG